jgi:maleate cis-trans isomerase
MRRKIGLLVPSGNTTVELDFMSIVPDGVTLHSMRIHGEKRNKVEAENKIDNINDKIEEFTKILAFIKGEKYYDINKQE